MILAIAAFLYKADLHPTLSRRLKSPLLSPKSRLPPVFHQQPLPCPNHTRLNKGKHIHPYILAPYSPRSNQFFVRRGYYPPPAPQGYPPPQGGYPPPGGYPPQGYPPPQQQVGLLGCPMPTVDTDAMRVDELSTAATSQGREEPRLPLHLVRSLVPFDPPCIHLAMADGYGMAVSPPCVAAGSAARHASAAWSVWIAAFKVARGLDRVISEARKDKQAQAFKFTKPVLV